MNDLSIFNGVKYRREPANDQTTCADCQIPGCSGPDYSDDWEPPVDCGVGEICCIDIGVGLVREYCKPDFVFVRAEAQPITKEKK